ncbi:hypothetical protein [Rhizobium leguminosarum]|uniref:hypothetical protein n=1 Tax=Rhizobium leguminosarum TaxID=384 RepID=UPI00103B90A8|nr:hypothetical protein [Rhizobium leguminosarum]TCA02554.1 hypothetical protein E0H57_20610 [Rhizobium leguminosarum bv. viciae]
MNDATRSFEEADLLSDILVGAAKLSQWRIKVEPALGRALDLMVGESLLQWITISDRLGVELSATGLSLAKEIEQEKEILSAEKDRIALLSTDLTETRVSQFLTVRAEHAVHDY